MCGSDFLKISGTSRQHVDIDIAPGLNRVNGMARNWHIGGFHLA